MKERDGEWVGGLFGIEMGVIRGLKSDRLKNTLDREDYGWKCSMFRVVVVNHVWDQMMNGDRQERH